VTVRVRVRFWCSVLFRIIVRFRLKPRFRLRDQARFLFLRYML
jgi:hypothetical protein